MHVRIAGCSGINSDKIGELKSRHDLKLNGRGVPVNAVGAYKPMQDNECVVKIDGELWIYPKNRIFVADFSNPWS